MTETQKIPYRRLAVEATAIVVSILLAFAIDAWWEERGVRQAETVLLERLRADFVEIETRLALVDKEHRDAREACITLLEFATGEQLPVTTEMDIMVAIVFLTSRTFNPGSGAVASFLSSEGEQLIRNQSLADLLLSWSGLVDELQEEEASLQKGVSERWTPYLASRVSLGPYVTSFEDLTTGLPDHISAPYPREPLTVDEEFQNHVLERLKWQQITLRDIEPVHAAIEKIITLLDEDLQT